MELVNRYEVLKNLLEKMVIFGVLFYVWKSNEDCDDDIFLRLVVR